MRPASKMIEALGKLFTPFLAGGGEEFFF